MHWGCDCVLSSLCSHALTYMSKFSKGITKSDKWSGNNQHYIDRERIPHHLFSEHSHVNHFPHTQILSWELPFKYLLTRHADGLNCRARAHLHTRPMLTTQFRHISHDIASMIVLRSFRDPKEVPRFTL
jgi:hypothetical protein